MHPWNKANIDAEREISRDYSLKNKKEIFIANSLLKKYKNIAKKLIATKTAQGEKEKEQVLKKLQNLGLLSTGSGLDNILGLELKDILERRLQSIVFRKGLARTMKQARQFIVHRHVVLGEKEISMPSYLVSLQEESQLKFRDRSALSDQEHPERINEKVVEEVKEVKDSNKKDEKVKKSIAEVNVDPEEDVTSEMEKELSAEEDAGEIQAEVNQSDEPKEEKEVTEENK